MRFTVGVINWDAISQATAWLPGAATGSLVGLIGAALTWEDLAADVCLVGTGPLKSPCVHLLGFTFTGATEFVAACIAVGGLVGIAVNGLINASSGEQSES